MKARAVRCVSSMKWSRAVGASVILLVAAALLTVVPSASGLAGDPLLDPDYVGYNPAVVSDIASHTVTLDSRLPTETAQATEDEVLRELGFGWVEDEIDAEVATGVIDDVTTTAPYFWEFALGVGAFSTGLVIGHELYHVTCSFNPFCDGSPSGGSVHLTGWSRQPAGSYASHTAVCSDGCEAASLWLSWANGSYWSFSWPAPASQYWSYPLIVDALESVGATVIDWTSQGAESVLGLVPQPDFDAGHVVVPWDTDVPESQWDQAHLGTRVDYSPLGESEQGQLIGETLNDGRHDVLGNTLRWTYDHPDYQPPKSPEFPGGPAVDWTMPGCRGLSFDVCTSRINAATGEVGDGPPTIFAVDASTPDPGVAPGAVTTTDPQAETSGHPATVTITRNPTDDTSPGDCYAYTDDPHWSDRGNTVVAKARIGCNYTTTVDVTMFLWRCETEPQPNEADIWLGMWGCVPVDRTDTTRILEPDVEQKVYVPDVGRPTVAPYAWFAAATHMTGAAPTIKVRYAEPSP